MANIGVYIELRGNEFKKSNREALAVARKSGGDVHAIIFADDITSFSADLKGISKVIQVKGAETFHPDFYAATLAHTVKAFDIDYLMGIFSAQGKDLFPRAAAKADASLVNDCIAVDLSAGQVKKPVFAGKLISTLTLQGEKRFITLRPNVFPPDPAADGPDPDVVTADYSREDERVRIVDIIQSESKKIDLSEAEIIVSGGRGMKARENFKILEELASVLNAGIGASRAAVDSDYATTDMQVGQTGKVVNPKLYIACGISGAIQHFVGMKTSKVIVAINKDPEAPIFKKADYGIVGDLFAVIPLLKEELGKVL